MDFENMTPDEINNIIDQAKQELIHRQNIDLVESQVRQVLLTARENGVTQDRGDGEEWVQPLGAHDSYLSGDTVTFEGKTYVSLSSASHIGSLPSGGVRSPTMGHLRSGCNHLPRSTRIRPATSSCSKVRCIGRSWIM